jgi:hypothetical protein
LPQNAPDSNLNEPFSCALPSPGTRGNAKWPRAIGSIFPALDDCQNTPEESFLMCLGAESMPVLCETLILLISRLDLGSKASTGSAYEVEVSMTRKDGDVY